MTEVMICRSVGNGEVGTIGGGMGTGGDLTARAGIFNRPISIVDGRFEDTEGAVITGVAAGGRSPSTMVVERAEARVFKRAEICSKEGSI
jgi:hypothetical protein